MDVCSDELALDYDGIGAAAYDMLEQGEIDRDQCECVKSLNEMLSRISGPVNAKLWTDEALISSPEWRAIRDSAKKCLALLQ
jgi:hypothetical protein